ncbi:MAG: hypothetical protein C5B52_04180 [Bacteroidetes bacterium]|nr:MAG: hypothetical protein C5B52_04180 [Bacteroidota bacterium]
MIEIDLNDDPRVDLAVERTLLSWERTQLAWIRTVLALVAGGIGLDKGLEVIHEQRLIKQTALVQSAQAIGISLSIIASVTIIFSTIFFVIRVRTLSKMTKIKTVWLFGTVFISLLIIILAVTISYVLITT